ncbi:hypothetical protein [Paenibacillus macquariensis]|uniref:SEC-C motif-containing protein n=1 Tax=Paenibacillus macquariensis TaxID=948756 RepID=A0ABY1K8Z5_9BACL|nr:hypothetical protein [Paenibacillus macquariensis]MEC0091511.1 hypothetical protein [Paenibacillus macquariensis]OAB26643.1 hypothetical protein PMSM_26105 [Paenibacillus macquariensis subsp. macquariensis]SIR43888.1 hypothetical protein SAMN05421578_11415 [Paenibacillus macquariensis]
MSWETFSDDRKPCPCGQGYVRSVCRSDDWGRIEEAISLHCAECEMTYVTYSYNYHRSGMIETSTQWVKREDYENFLKFKADWEAADLLAKTQITEYLRLNYLETWMTLFQGVRRNKKAVWSKLRDLRITEYSYSLFCKKIDASQVDDHIESYVSYHFSEPVLRILDVNDEFISTLSSSSRDANERYQEARREMFQHAFS